MKKLITLFILLASFAGVSHAAEDLSAKEKACSKQMETTKENLILLQAQAILNSRATQPAYDELESIKDRMDAGLFDFTIDEAEVKKSMKSMKVLFAQQKEELKTQKKSLKSIHKSLLKKCNKIDSKEKMLTAFKGSIGETLSAIEQKEQRLALFELILHIIDDSNDEL